MIVSLIAVPALVGNYNIELNADSWRGIGRTFRGKHTIRVTAGNSYGVGTLAAKF